MDATIENEVTGLAPGQTVHRAWLTESWSDPVCPIGGGFHVWFDTGRVSEVEDPELGPVIRSGRSLYAFGRGGTGHYGQWFGTKGEAVEAVVAELRRRIATLHQQCDRLVTEMRNEAT